MNILWVKDGKLGHEKQVDALLEEISSTQHIDITEIKASTVLNQILELITFGLLIKGIDGVENIGFDLIIGAGSNTHLEMINLKKRFKKGHGFYSD